MMTATATTGTYETYASLIVKYATQCYLCKRKLKPGNTAHGSAPHGRRKRWRWICSKGCAEKHGFQLEGRT